MFSIAQKMEDEIAAFEIEENLLRPDLPGVFSLGEF